MISQSKKHRSGFTLVELMITLLVLAIILGIALPSFSALIEKLAIRSTTESIVEAFRTARVTAVEEQTDIKVCGLGANNTCSNADWDKGLIILRNSNSETLYLIRFKESILVKPLNQANITFNNQGWTNFFANSIFVCKASDDNKNAYRIVVSRSGRIRTESYDETPGGWKDSNNNTLSCNS